MAMTNYLWDEVNDTLLAETDGNGETIAEYTHEPGQFGPLISQRRNGQTSYHHYDGLGSTRALTDESSNVTDRYTYSAFGETVASSGTSTNPFGWSGWVGYYYDEALGTFYIRAREYQPSTGRWMSQDPIGFASGDPNLYRYVGDNPVIWVDPFGFAGVSQDDRCCECNKQDVKDGGDASAQLRAFFSQQQGMQLFGGGHRISWHAEGTGNPAKCRFLRYKLDYDENANGVSVNDKAFNRDGPAMQPPMTVIQAVPPNWTFQDGDAPALLLRKGLLPGKKDAVYIDYVVNSDGTIRESCCNMLRVSIVIWGFGASGPPGDGGKEWVKVSVKAPKECVDFAKALEADKPPKRADIERAMGVIPG